MTYNGKEFFYLKNDRILYFEIRKRVYRQQSQFPSTFISSNMKLHFIKQIISNIEIWHFKKTRLYFPYFQSSGIDFQAHSIFHCGQNPKIRLKHHL